MTHLEFNDRAFGKYARKAQRINLACAADLAAQKQRGADTIATIANQAADLLCVALLLGAVIFAAWAL
jgi:hypothetical protein